MQGSSRPRELWSKADFDGRRQVGKAEPMARNAPKRRLNGFQATGGIRGTRLPAYRDPATGPLFAHHVAGVPFVIANVLDEFRVGLQIEFHEYGPRLLVSLGIVNRHRNI